MSARITDMAFPEPAKEPAKPAEVSPEAKPAEVKAEPVAQADDVPAEIKSTKAAENWKRLRAERDTISKERDEFKSKWEAASKAAPKASTEPNPEFETIKKERDQYSELLRLQAIQSHPKFDAFFGQKVQSAVEAVKSAIGGEQGDAVAKVLLLPESASKREQLNELAATLGPLEASQLGAATLELRKIEGERNAEISKAKENYTAMQQAEQQKQQQRVVQLNKTFDDEFTKAQDPKSPIEFLQPKEGDAEWNSGVEALKAHAKNIYNGSLSEAEAAQASMWAATGPLYKTYAETVSKENSQLKTELASLRDATPKPGAGGDPKTGEAKTYKNSIEAVLDQAVNNGFVKRTA